MSQAEPVPGLSPGTRLIKGRFEIKKKLGTGGMGEVYLCFDERLSRHVAMKRISADKEDNESRARFLREARVASQLDHGNICPIYEIYEEEESQYIVMQYVDGVTLETIRKHQKLSLSQVVDIALQVCQGMQAAHEKGVIHRDIKAANIMIDRQGRVKILDFGLAKIHHHQFIQAGGETVPMTEKGMVIGTVTHMSPEQAKGEELDERTDIFSFGVVLFELLEGGNPFWCRDNITTLYNIIHQEPPFTETTPQPLRQVVSDCLEKHRKKRVASFGELAQRIEESRDILFRGDSAPAHTEILSGNEVEVIRKAVSSSDGSRNLKDIVYRINRFKATTSPVSAVRKRKLWLLAAALGLLTGLIIWLTVPFHSPPAPVTPQTLKPAVVLVNPFRMEGSATEKGETLGELVAYVLNHYPGVSAVMPGWFGGSSPVLSRLSGKDAPAGKEFAALYQLEGKALARKEYLDLDARLEERGKADEPMKVTLKGLGTASLIDHQVKTLGERVARRILGDSSPALVTHIDLPMLFGNDWEGISRYFQALKFYRRLEYARAGEILKKIEFMPPARYLLAEIAFFNGDNTRAAELVNRGKPMLEQYPLQLGLLFRSLDHRLKSEPDLEAKLLRKLVDRFPLDKTVQYRLGEAYFHTGNAEEAVPYYLAALELDEVFPPALNHLAYCYAYQGLHDKAFVYFEKYHQLDRSVNSFDSFGDGYFYAGDLDTARAFKESALAENPKETSWALLTLADIHVLKGRYDQAEKTAEAYAALSPDDGKIAGEALVKKAWMQMVQGGDQAALKLLDEALLLSPRAEREGDPAAADLSSMGEPWREVHWLRGWALIRLGKSRQAAEELAWMDRIVERVHLSRERFTALLKYRDHLRALVDAAGADENSALEGLRRILEYGPRLNYWITYYNQSFFHCELIRLLLRLERYPEASLEIEKAALFNPRYPPLLWLRLRLAEKIGVGVESAQRLLRDVLGQNYDKMKPPPILD